MGRTVSKSGIKKRPGISWIINVLKNSKNSKNMVNLVNLRLEFDFDHGF
jgi:hypothetical protein